MMSALSSLIIRLYKFSASGIMSILSSGILYSFNKRDKEFGFITYKDTQAQVNISTQLIADKKIQLFMDYISFKVDL